jgi:hypothetical protein
MSIRIASAPLATAFSIGITLLAASTVFAQSVSSAPTTGAQAEPATGVPWFARGLVGRNVWISADGTRIRGQVTSVGPTGLVLLEDGVATTIVFKEIVRVEKSSHRLRNGALVGMSVGAGLGFLGAVGGGMTDGEPTCAILAPIWAGIGAGAGVGIGAIVHAAKKNSDVLYDARRSTRTMSLAPILSPTGKGIAFSMTWR